MFKDIAPQIYLSERRQTGEELSHVANPVTYLWSRTWREIIALPNSAKVHEALNSTISWCQVIIARRRDADKG